MATGEKFDIIVFGATGYTGKCVVQELMLKYTVTRERSWAVAGRNERKLRELLDWASSSLKLGRDASAVDVIIADCGDEKSLDAMTRRAKVIINCCGPFILYGEQVIKACIQNGTHHVDITAEPEYMEKMYLEHHRAAEEAGVFIISACAFESVPFDLGVTHFMQNFPGVVNSVDLYVKCFLPKPAATLGTWSSVVNAIPTLINFIRINRQLFSTLNALKLEPRQKASFIRRSPVFDNQMGVQFLQAMKTVSLRTQQFLYTNYQQRPVQLEFYLVFWSFTYMLKLFFGLLLIGFFVIILCGFSCGRKLLIRHPRFFSLGMVSREGPSEEGRARSFAIFRFSGDGWSTSVADKYQRPELINEPTNTRMVTEISFPDMGYGFSAKTALQSAVTILEEYELMPSKGGVLTPGVAFMKTNFWDNLAKQGVKLSVLPDPISRK